NFRLLSYDYKFQISTMRYTLLIQVILFTVSSQILAQNVGIGTPNPTEKLHIDNGDLKIGNLVWASASNDHVLKFGENSFVTIGETGQDDRMSFAARNFIFTPSGSYTGYIGINVATPLAPLSFGNIMGEKITFWN